MPRRASYEWVVKALTGGAPSVIVRYGTLIAERCAVRNSLSALLGTAKEAR
jgi:hypothetical protein